MACIGCRDGADFAGAITMALQPIVNVTTGEVFAQEALVRGAGGSPAADVLGSVTEQNRYAFDQLCRVRAIETASRLGVAELGQHLSVNFLPNAVYEPRACIRLTLATAMKQSFPLDRIIFEFTEGERLDVPHVLNILRSYRAMGFKTAIDDFGAGYAGLTLLAEFQPDFVKLDMELIRALDRSSAKQVVVRNTIRMLVEMNVTPICEGVETEAEFEILRNLGVELMQGYLFARPALEALSPPHWPGRPAYEAFAAAG
jgi:EAL domain-containing protein (putative c-di-GMP-specific phosphodiesterase class I)